MIINPAIISLTGCSVLVGMAAVYASIIGARVILNWNLKSGSETQLALERQTYLVSTVLNYVMVCELFSLFLFIAMADNIHTLLIGAMCAAGTLNANAFGYPTLTFKIINFILCGVWVLINHIDNHGYDYPLIRFKYIFLFFITLSILAEAVLQSLYFLGLEPEIITSCCGTLFNEDSSTVAGEMAALPPVWIKAAYYSLLALVLITGARFYQAGKGAWMFFFLNIGLLLISVEAVISYISLYYYQLPTHHCPFCLLQKEYHHIGYLLYLSMFFACIAGCVPGLVHPFRHTLSLKTLLRGIQKRLCIGSMAGHIVFASISTYPMLFSNFKL